MSTQSTLLNERYELLRELGHGGTATVWEARDRALERRVAVKLLHPQFAGDPELLERFRREAQAAARLGHPNIVSVYDVGEDAATGNPFLVMELVEGEDLKERIRRDAPLADEVIREVGAQVAGALGFAHQRGLIHRDVKPQNILLGEDGRPRLTDFGIARAFDVGGLTRTGVVMGSVHYLAPELARGGPTTPASDIYGLGAVLYEMATGRVPFTGTTEVGVLLAHIEQPVTPPGSLNPRLGPDLDRTIRRALAKSPGERFATAGDLAAALRGRGADQPTAAMAPTSVEQPTRRVAAVTRPAPVARAAVRPPAPPGGAGLVALLLVLAAVLLAGGAAFFGLGMLGREPSATPAPPATRQPAAPPTAAPTARATVTPTAVPTETPTAAPTAPPTAAPTVAPTAAPTAPPAKPPAPPAASPPAQAPPSASAAPDPTDTIRLHYTLIDARRYDEGYRLMSARLRAANSLSNYESWFANKVGLKPLSVTLVSQDGPQAVVDTRVESTDRVGGQTTQQQVAERFVLRLEDGAWHIDQVTRLG